MARWLDSFMINDLRQSPEWGKFLESIGWEVEEIQASSSRCQVFIRKIPLLGSVIKIQRPPGAVDFEQIDKIAKKNKALFVKLEPCFGAHEGSGSAKRSRSPRDFVFKRDSWPLLPTRTIWIDLTKSEEQLLKEMRKNTRYYVRRSGRENFAVITNPLSSRKTPLEDFYHLLKITGRRGKFWVPPFKHLKSKAEAFGSEGWLVSAHASGSKEMLAGAVVLTHNKGAFYHHAASSDRGQEIFAPYAVMWKTIRLTKKSGCEILDLEGIYDQRYSKVTKGWKGFTRFKKGFGGQIIEFPGSYTKHYNPFTRVLFGLR